MLSNCLKGRGSNVSAVAYIQESDGREPPSNLFHYLIAYFTSWQLQSLKRFGTINQEKKRIETIEMTKASNSWGEKKKLHEQKYYESWANYSI